MQNLWDILEQGAPDETALVVPDGPRLTYAALRDEAQRGAATLAALGVGRGDAVASVFPNGAPAVLVFLSAALAGCAAPLNPAYTEPEFSYYLEDVQARVLLVPAGEAAAARRALPEGARVVEVELTRDGGLQFDAGSSRTGDPARPGADDVALMLHTSGTTGRPKRVPLRQRNLAASVQHIAESYQLGPDDVSMCVMPLFHVHGLIASALSTFASGGTVAVPAPFNPLGFWSAAAKVGATWYSAVPTMQRMLASRLRAEAPPSLRFIRTCSSALPPELMASLESKTGVPVLEAYGMTEACHQISSNPLPPGERRPGSVGLATGVELAVFDPEWQPVGPGVAGEIVVRGPNVVDGYADAPEANAASFRDGWFRTGDEGTLDAAGYLTIVGRIKELINRGGEKIAPREIDEVLLSHPAVSEAIAFATPHPALGQDVAAAVVVSEPVSEGELIDYCKTRLAPFKVPRTLRFVDALPRTATGKPQRSKVAQSLGLGE